MKKIKPITKPQDVQFFSIIMADGMKCIHFRGSIEQDVDEEWSQFGDGFIMSLNSFLYNLSKDFDFLFDCFGAGVEPEMIKEEDVVDRINSFYPGGADGYLDITKITQETPCGNYICTEDIYSPELEGHIAKEIELVHKMMLNSNKKFN